MVLTQNVEDLKNANLYILSFERIPVLDSSRKRGMSNAWQCNLHMKRNAKSENGQYRQKKLAVVYAASFFVKRISEGIIFRICRLL